MPTGLVLSLYPNDAMKVYAGYFSDGLLNFRLNTVLRFGDSWNVIGAAVLINPGSSKPMGDIDSDTFERLSAITGHADGWKEFSADVTMRQVSKIFNGWYIGEDMPLSGCILLFNLFNLRDGNLSEALELQKDCKSEHLFSTEEDLARLTGVERIYLGWGSTGKHHLRQYAEAIFEAVKAKCPYLDVDFNRNAFYHPGYINRSYRSNFTTQKILKDFIS